MNYLEKNSLNNKNDAHVIYVIGYVKMMLHIKSYAVC